MSVPLIAEQITSHIGSPARGLKVEVLASTQSTNSDLRARVSGLTEPLLLTTEHQTAGRGRSGRSWHTAAGDSLCFSLAWPFMGSVDRMTGLPLATGVAIAEALHILGWPVQLKWPNDLLLGGKKLGGVLIETATAPLSLNVSKIWAVIGVGMNVHPNLQRDADVDFPTAFLSDQSLDRNQLLAKIADSLCEMLVEFNHHGLSPFIDRWHTLHAYQDQPVVLHERGQLLHEGIARGITANGSLILDTAQARLTLMAGDVSLRSTQLPNTIGVHHAAAD
jgi:BirA family biotin operon repressor/biotin-[acetyl-CoA-carboxylase] ligase